MLKNTIITFIAISILSAIGCSMGNAPAGMSGDDAKSAIAKMKPEERIRAIAGSPMAGPEKEKEFLKIEKETGVKAADVLGKAGAGSPGAGAASTVAK